MWRHRCARSSLHTSFTQDLTWTPSFHPLIFFHKRLPASCQVSSLSSACGELRRGPLRASAECKNDPLTFGHLDLSSLWRIAPVPWPWVRGGKKKKERFPFVSRSFSSPRLDPVDVMSMQRHWRMDWDPGNLFGFSIYNVYHNLQVENFFYKKKKRLFKPDRASNPRARVHFTAARDFLCRGLAEAPGCWSDG